MTYSDRISADGPLTSRLGTKPTRGFLPAQSIDPPFVDGEIDDDEALSETARENPDGFDAALGTLLRILLDVEESEPRNALARELNGVCERIVAHISHAKARRAAELRSQLDAVMDEGREAKAQLDELRATSGGLRTQLHGLQERLAQASRRLREALAARPREDSWPSEGEVSAWRERVREAEAALVEARTPHDEQKQRVAGNDADVRVAKARLDELTTRRDSLRTELDGPRVRKMGG